MKGRAYPTVAEAIEIHRQLIEEFGGAYGLRDRGRLEAAIFRPQIGFYTELSDAAAALMESLANNHPFLDGNKRMCFAVTDVFLRLNGYYLEVDPAVAYKFFTETMGEGKFRFAVIREWIARHMKRLAA